MSTHSCTHRGCAIPKLILLIKMASENPPTGMTSEEIVETGLNNLRTLGVTVEELADAAIYLAIESATFLSRE
jgi:hypothetical protein